MNSSSNQPAALDRTDLKILHSLQEDGRISNLKLAEAVSLSPTAVLARVQRLTKEGYILGYEARLNPLLLHAAATVFVEIELDHSNPDFAQQLEQAVLAHTEIMECHMVAASFDYLLKVRVSGLEAYRDLARDVIWRLPGVRSARSYAVLSSAKNSTHLKLA